MRLSTRFDVSTTNTSPPDPGRNWMAKVVFLIQMLLTFGGRCNRYFWDIRLKILRLPNFNMFFQLKFFKSELFSCLPKVDHVIKSCKEPIDKAIIIDNHILIDIDCVGQSKEIDGCFISLLALSILSILTILSISWSFIAFEVQKPTLPRLKNLRTASDWCYPMFLSLLIYNLSLSCWFEDVLLE